MPTFLTILLIAAMIATVTMLVRGIIVFLKTTEADLKAGATGPSASGLKQNKMMFSRIKYQALAIIAVAVLMLFNR